MDPLELPIHRHADAIVAAIAASPVVIVQGETGCGKTTQLPRICLGAGRARQGMLGLTQPRRIAARAVAARIAQEMGVAVGSVVAHQVRFEDRSSRDTRIKVVTDGILLAQLRSDRLLSRYDTIIVDEAHERSLNIDFLLGCLARILRRRDDLKVIIASATIDAARFSRHFGDAPIVEVPGRMHPVSVRYSPVVADDSGEPEKVRAICDAVAGLLGETEGDGLVFLPGEREIHEVMSALSGRVKGDAEVLPLYARLSAQDQDRALAGTGLRRVILATNVAETSLTVPRIRFVVDSGDVRVLRYSPKARIQRLPIERVSKAAASQRSGRCGRIAPGICVRLYDEAEHADFADWSQPEIQRVNLASVLLQMASLDLGDIEHFPFLDPPNARAVEEGRATLTELGAFGPSGRLTNRGRMMARLPIDPRLSRVLLESMQLGCMPEALVVAASLSVGDPKERPLNKSSEADFAQMAWRDPQSDLGSILRLWRAWRQKQDELGSSALRRWCRESFLSHQRLREWDEIHRQLRRLVEGGWDRAAGQVGGEVAEPVNLEPLHRSLLAGFVSNVAQRTEEGEYELASGQRFTMHPASALARSGARWIVAAEIVDTGRRLGRTGVRVHSHWIEQVAPHLVKRSISDPHWVKDTGQAAAWERVTLGALVISPRRRVPLGPIDPIAARQHFIQGALVEELVPGDPPPFMARNRELRLALEAEEARRRRPLIAGELARHAFFDARIPESIHSWPSFVRWLKSDAQKTKATLEMSRRDLLADPEDPEAAEATPAIAIAGVERKVDYLHRPGDERDGACVRVPLAAAALIDARTIAWGPPSALTELCEGMIRSLPKSLRMRLIPAAEVAEGAATALSDRAGDFVTRLAAHCSTVAGTRIAPADFGTDRLEGHLRIRIEVTAADGTVIDADRDAHALVARVRDRSLAEFASIARAFGPAFNREGAKRWAHESLPAAIPDTMDAPAGSPVSTVFPALVDRGATVDLRAFPDALSAHRSMRQGIIRLLANAIASRVGPHAEHHPKWETIAFTAIRAGIAPRELLADCPDAIAIDHVDRLESLPRSLEAMAHEEDLLAASLGDRASCLVEKAHAFVAALAGIPRSSAALVQQLIEERVRTIAPVRALRTLTAVQLSRAPRRLDALAARARKAAAKGEAWDRDLAARFAPFDAAARQALLRASSVDEWRKATEFADLVEEFAVSLWAQELGTLHAVSEQRLERLSTHLNVREIQVSSGHM